MKAAAIISITAAVFTILLQNGSSSMLIDSSGIGAALSLDDLSIFSTPHIQYRAFQYQGSRPKNTTSRLHMETNWRAFGDATVIYKQFHIHITSEGVIPDITNYKAIIKYKELSLP